MNVFLYYINMDLFDSQCNNKIKIFKNDKLSKKTGSNHSFGVKLYKSIHGTLNEGEDSEVQLTSSIT